MADGRFILQNLDSDSESEPEFPMEGIEHNVEIRAVSVEDIIEKALLEDIIIGKELDYHQNFIRSSISPEEGNRIIKEMYYEEQKRIGYHVDVWPPKAVTATLQVEKVLDVTGEDRLALLRNKIDTFSSRVVLELERRDDAFAIIVQDEHAGRAIIESEAFQEFQTISIFGTQYENTQIRISNAIERYSKTVLIFTADLVAHCAVFPFASLVILHGFTNICLFKKAIESLTKGSRIYKQSCSISVPLNKFDEPTIIECAATLLGARGEQITRGFLEFVETSCWNGRANERNTFERWESSVKNANLTKDYEIRKLLGVRVEFWWNFDETLKKVKVLVQPVNEDHDDLERPWDNNRFERNTLQ